MADLSDVVTVYKLNGATFNQALPANTRRVLLWADGLTAVTMKDSSGGTAYVMRLNTLHELKGDNLGGRTLYFTTSTGEYVYMLCEHDPT